MDRDLEQNDKIVQLTSELDRLRAEKEQEQTLRLELETNYQRLLQQYNEAIDYIKKQKRASSSQGSGCLFFIFLIVILFILLLFVSNMGVPVIR